jgi:hypothetical protein
MEAASGRKQEGSSPDNRAAHHSTNSSDSSKSPRANAVDNEHAIREVYNALALIPDAAKASFLKAKQSCPDLFETECDPMRFLRYDGYDFWKAAKRMVAYWEAREKLFGERAFLPMTQTGEGALSTEAVMALHTGSFALLPTTPKGEEIMFIERSRFLAESTKETKVQSMFYMLSHLSKAEHAQTRGAHIVIVLISPRLSPVDPVFVRGAIAVINLLPVKLKIHLLMCLPKQGMTPMVQQVLSIGVSHAAGNVDGLQLHSKSIGEPILTEMNKVFGLEADSWPASIGGSWKYENYTSWCREKIAEELAAVAAKASTKKKHGTMSAEKKRKRTQCLNVIHSRQKRERRKAELQELQDVCNKLMDDKQMLRKDNVHLEKLMAAAQHILLTMEAGVMHPARSASAATNPPPPSLFATLHLPSTLEPAAAHAYLPIGEAGVASAASPQAGLVGAVDLLLNQSPEVRQMIMTVLQGKLVEEEAPQPPVATLHTQAHSLLPDIGASLGAQPRAAFASGSSPTILDASATNEGLVLNLLALLARQQQP